MIPLQNSGLNRFSWSKALAWEARVSVAAGVAAILFLSVGCRSTQPQQSQHPLPGQAAAAPHQYPGASSGGQAPQQGQPYAPVPANPQEQQHSAPAPPPTPVVLERPRHSPGGLQAPAITARAGLLVDSRGRVLFEKNAHSRMPVASTQKLLLAILIAENGNLSKPVTVADSDTWAEPTKLGIKAGQVYTRHELLRAVLIRSSNDVANCLARDHSGSVTAFVSAMNRKARMIGMRNSHFTNAHGLPTPSGQYSTAHDLVILAQAAMRKPVIRDAVRSKGMVFRFSNGSTKTLHNTNQVLKQFPYCIGMKTGYTNAAGRCLVSAATTGSRTCYAVILGSKTPTVWQESEALLRFGLGL